jgi:S-DNA-T family DNA segregation ATPase FtsK/SpoIIIE
MIDPKFVQWNIYNDLPHLVSPVVHDTKEAILTLNWVVNEVKKRYQIFTKVGTRNIGGFNSRTQKKSPREDDIEIPDKLSYIVVIIDELADLMLMAQNDVENSIARITQMARAAGIHCIVATQRPSVDVITDKIKTSIPARIAFLVAAMADSQTILDDVGAEKLLGKGDMLFKPPGTANLRRVQGCLVTDEEINRIVEIVKTK